MRYCIYSMLGVSLFVVNPFVTAPASTPEPQALDPERAKGIEIQGRGQIHEAFAQPLDPQPGPGAIVPKEPPPPIPEQPPEQRPEGDNVQWIPGYWAWDADRNDYIWISGVYRNAPQARQYVAGYWQKTDEGYRWVSGFWAPANQAEVPYTAPQPPALPENGPSMPPPDANSFYIPGNWAYNNGYVWRPGFYTAFRSGLVWIPAQWMWTPAGWVFVSGYWDYPLENRGLLFASVYFSEPLWQQQGWFYRPSFGVRVGPLLDSFFVRGGHYYFGDYYGSTYARRGYHPWFGARHDPLYTYYRWNNRANSQWANGLNANFTARNAGRLAVPGRTFVANSTGGATALVAPLSQINTKATPLTQTSGSQLAAHTAAAQRLRDLAQNRGKIETAAASNTNANTTRALNLSGTSDGGTKGPALNAPRQNAVHSNSANAPRVLAPSNTLHTPAIPKTNTLNTPSIQKFNQVPQPKVLNTPSIPKVINNTQPRIINTPSVPRNITNTPSVPRNITTTQPRLNTATVHKNSATPRTFSQPAAHQTIRSTPPARSSGPAHSGGQRGGGNHGGAKKR